MCDSPCPSHMKQSTNSNAVGQTPKKLFTSPHPPRNLEGFLSLPVTIARGVPEDALALARDSKPFKGKCPIFLLRSFQAFNYLTQSCWIVLCRIFPSTCLMGNIAVSVRCLLERLASLRLVMNKSNGIRTRVIAHCDWYLTEKYSTFCYDGLS